MPASMVDQLDRLAERRHRDPVTVLEQARAALEAGDEPAVLAAAHWVAGLALHELGRAPDALTHYREAVELSVAHHLAGREALARAGAAVSLVSVGDGAAAEHEICVARAGAPALVRPVIEMLYGLVLQRTGRLADAVVVYRAALRELDRTGDQPTAARLRLNRGILYAYQGNLDAAVDDLSRAEQIAVDRELSVLAAMAAHNLGFASGRQGRLPEALAAFDRAAAAYAALDGAGRLIGVLEADRCEILLLAGLVPEAVAAATTAIAALERVGDHAHLAESRLLHARALLAAGEHNDAAGVAALAAEELGRARRFPWAAQARYLAIQAETLATQEQVVPSPALLDRARAIAAELADRGWPVEALHVRTFVGRLALALDEPDIARSELAGAAGARRRGTADLRAQAWHATALLHLAGRDRAGARRALKRGMAVIDEHRATLGATELRARAAGHGAELARLGMQLALADGAPLDVLRWVERSRAATLRQAPMRPPDDAVLARDLAELRRARAELRSATLEGNVAPALHRRILELERDVRDRTLRAEHAGGPTATQLDVNRLRAALGDGALVEYVSLEGRLHAVTVTRSRVRLHDLGPSAAIGDEKDYLLFALRRVLSARRNEAADDALAGTAQRLDEILVQPLGLRQSAVVIVPSGELHGLPWSCLPGLRQRATTVAPSAGVWLAEETATEPGDGGTVLVAGPDLPGAVIEVDALVELHRGAEVLAGEHATAANVLAAIERADLVHVAAHGSFRADSPLFSSLLFADGPLTVYDLERLGRGPTTIVLSVCDAALNAVHLGDELLGTAAALLALGVRSVIAPVLPVPDAATVAAMVSLHRHLVGGASPAVALARAAGDEVAAAAFVCIGRAESVSG